MIAESALPDIPRLLTASAEWSACLFYILLIARRRWIRVAPSAALALGALIGVHLLADRLPTSLWTLGMVTALVVMYGFIASCTRTPTTDSGYLLARAFVLAELIASLHWQLHVYFFPDGEFWALTAVPVFAACLSAAWFIERRFFRHEPPGVDHRALSAAAAIAAVTFLMSNLSFLSANTPFSGEAGLEVFYIRTLVDLAGYAALIALHSQRLQLRRSRDVQMMHQLVRSQHEQYLQSRRNIEQVNRKYHDLKHHITAFRAETDPSSKAASLDQLERSIAGYGQQVQTGSAIIDAVLTAKLAEAAEHGVQVNVTADGAALEFMDPLDLSALLGNAMDNAVTGASQVGSPERRLVRVSVRRRDGFVLLSVENSYAQTLVLDADGLPRSTKRDTENHGYGLRNMRQIAERHGGTLAVNTADRWFSITVLMPQPK